MGGYAIWAIVEKPEYNILSMLYRLYVGADNKTNKVPKKKLAQVLNKHLQGYTLQDSMGLWEGKREPGVVVEVETRSRKRIYTTAEAICVELEQDAVGVVRLPSRMEFYERSKTKRIKT